MKLKTFNALDTMLQSRIKKRSNAIAFFERSAASAPCSTAYKSAREFIKELAHYQVLDKNLMRVYRIIKRDVDGAILAGYDVTEVV